MATVKNFGLAGVSSDVQFGKGGARIIENGSGILQSRDSANAAFALLRAASPVLGSADNQDVVTVDYLNQEIADTNLTDFQDVDITSASAGEYLRYDGANWVDSPLNISDDSAPQLGGALDANNNVINNLADPTTDQQAATKAYVDSQLEASDQLGELNDVTLGALAANEYLRYNGSGQWVNVELDISDDTAPVLGGALDANNNFINNLPTPTTAGQAAPKDYVDDEIAAANVAQVLNDHADVVITAAASGEYLRYNGSNWVDAALSISDDSAPTLAAALDAGGFVINNLADPTTSDQAATKDYVDTEIANSAANIALDDLTDVIITAAASGEYLRYDGANWVDAALSIVDDTTPQLGGALDANSNLINNVTDPVSAQDAATKAYVDSEILAQTLTDHDDVVITSAASGEYLRYDGANWVDSPLNIVDDASPELAAALDAMNFQINNLADPSVAQDAATKAYVDSVAQGLDVKNSARVATTAALGGTYTPSNDDGSAMATPWSGLSGLVVDGVTVADGDRILVKNETGGDVKGHGIFIYNSGAGTLSRADDADNTPENEVSGGMFTFIEEGATNADTGWVLTSPNGNASLGSDDLEFTQFAGAGAVTINGTSNEIDVAQNGNDFTISISNTYVGQTSITTVGTISSGTWQGTAIDHERGGLEADVSGFADGSLYIHNSGGAQELAVGNNGEALMVRSGALVYDQMEAVDVFFDATGLVNTSATELQTAVSDLDSALANLSQDTIQTADTSTRVFTNDANETIEFFANSGQVAGLSATLFDIDVQIAAQDGSAAAPAYSFETAQDSGMYYDPAAGGNMEDHVCISVDGTEVACFRNQSSVTPDAQMIVEAGDGEVRLLGVDSSGTNPVDIRLIPQGAGEVFLGEPGTTATIAASDATGDNDGEDLRIIAGTGSTNGDGGDIQVLSAQGAGTGADGKVFFGLETGANTFVEGLVVCAADADVDYVQVDSGNGDAQISVAGDSTNADLILAAKGTGVLKAGADFTAVANEDLVTKGFLDTQLGNTDAGKIDSVVASFDFNSSGSLSVTLPDGARVVRAKINITTPLSAGGEVEFGISGDTDRFVANADVDSQTAGLYLIELFDAALSGDQDLHIALGGAPAAGAGEILVEFRLG